MNKESNAFLYKYLNNNAPVGQEVNGQKIWLSYLKPYVDDYFTDAYGTAVGVINPNAEYKVVLEAHADEIAWYINYISKEGYIYVIRNGGSDYEIAPSMHAKIHTTDKGVLNAVFGWPAIHVRRTAAEKEKKPNIENVVLDAGFSSKEEAIESGVNVGDIVTFDQDLREVNGKYWVGRGLDNRMGGFTIAEVARMLHETKAKLPFGLYIVNAVQEEVGHNGARMIAERIRPDVALVTDVCHCTGSPLYNKIKHGDTVAGKGPVISTAPAVHPNMRKMLLEVAKREKIDFQLAASQYATGTDTDTFAFSHRGVPSALLSTPLKYMHTTVEMVHQADVDKLVKWMYHFLTSLEDGHRFDFDITV